MHTLVIFKICIQTFTVYYFTQFKRIRVRESFISKMMKKINFSPIFIKKKRKVIFELENYQEKCGKSTSFFFGTKMKNEKEWKKKRKALCLTFDHDLWVDKRWVLIVDISW